MESLLWNEMVFFQGQFIWWNALQYAKEFYIPYIQPSLWNVKTINVSSNL